jgi:hypothetical protein
MERREFLKYVGIAGVAIAVPVGLGSDSIRNFFWKFGVDIINLPIANVEKVGGLIEKYALRADSVTGELHRYAWPIENPTPTSYQWYVDITRTGSIYKDNRFCGFYQSEDELRHFFPQIMSDLRSGAPSKKMYDKWADDVTRWG